MRKDLSSANERPQSENASIFGAGIFDRSPKHQKRMTNEKLTEVFGEIQSKLDNGLSSAAEKIIDETLRSFSLKLDEKIRLHSQLSFVYETQGRYQDALDTLRQFEEEFVLDRLDADARVTLITQIAVAYNNAGDYPKAVALLKSTLEEAEAGDLRHLFGGIYAALARVYRKLNEFPIARDNAEKALKYFRESADWRGMAESYHLIAQSLQQGGNSEKSLEFYNQAIKIVGSRSAPFLLGKIYSDMSGALWFLRRPQEGISCLEKSISFFEQTEHKVQSTAAYNNLGINLMMLGAWTKAEEVFKHALELAFETNHRHIAGILDSLGELKMLRGDFEEAQELLEQGVALAEDRKFEWYAIQALRTLARCLLLQGKLDEAIAKAEETIERCEKIGERQVGNLAGLVLAEAYFESGKLRQCEKQIEAIELSDPTADFFVLGNIQRIRGLLALKNQTGVEIALHHFNRALSIFETAEDSYHTALAQFEIGKAILDSEPERAGKYLKSAIEVFERLETRPVLTLAKAELEKLQAVIVEPELSPAKRREHSASSQLLMLRLAEAVASRELLFRELVAILQQESKASRILIAESKEQQKTFYPFITHGFTSAESMELVAKAQQAQLSGNLEHFAKTKNLSIFPLRAPSAPPAMLMIHPRSGANLLDGSLIQPLLRVVELGMDVCALREKDKAQQTEQEVSPFTSQSLMQGFIHSSPAMTSLVEEVYKIRSSDVTVLVTGESGTGKELVSRAIHTLSNRKDKVFVPFNCTAVPKELAEGHLFGYRKGAFTGAVNDSVGVIRSANGGTLFLDEVGDLPLEVQPKLLRFLQEGEIQPLGEKAPIKVDVRVIAATNMPLEEKVADGSFREDLYYRLNVIRLRVPPLRERRSEIPPIVNYYLNQYSARFNKRDLNMTPQTMDLLMVCEWEGNVRQLCNEVQRIVARAEDGETITPDHLSHDLKRSAVPIPSFAAGNITPISAFNTQTFNIANNGGTLEEAVSELEKRMIREAMRRHNNNISRVARELGLTRRGLYLKLGRYQLDKAES
ncbi:MAG TPA: sigma 54-interacting transcriptional regulator [Pyrinomonadaceae bacterium]|jgi:transcriptional regulator with GAF, ATPase, and Fis domain/Tfp pilus assembly protein PilF